MNSLYKRAPPQYKSDSDLELFMRRFFANTRAANVGDDEQADLLIILLDHKAVNTVSYMKAEDDFDLKDLVTSEIR